MSTKRTRIRWRYATIITFLLSAALLGGTYINARYGGPSSITIDSDSVVPTPPKTEKDWLGGNGKIDYMLPSPTATPTELPCRLKCGGDLRCLDFCDQLERV